MSEAFRSVIPFFPDFRGALVFFDLSGTLVEQDAHLLDKYKDTLLLLGAEAGRIVLVTGQSEEDPQVEEVCRFFVEESPVSFVAYVTRGGLRLVKRGAVLEKDPAYLEETCLDEWQQRSLGAAIDAVLSRSGLTPFIPVQCIDGVALRVNLPPSDRPAFVDATTRQLARDGLRGFQVIIEGRTSVFIMRQGVGKRKAVEFELRAFIRQEPGARAYFFGNEFNERGNDREVATIPHLHMMPLGPYDAFSEGTAVQAVGHTPDDLYAFLRCYLRSNRGVERRLSVVFISLGGTKIQMGAITEQSEYTSDDEIYWRGEADFAGSVDDEEPASFCDALGQRAEDFLTKRGYEWADVGRVGIGFPGPHSGGLWYSNNLPAAFRAGVNLEDAFRETITRRTNAQPPAVVRVVFDAQCDAGGELFHARGRFFQAGGRVGRAVVLNVATGIAAGLIRDGRVLVGDTDFETHLGSTYDGGAGQIGRHLWYDLHKKTWAYHYCAGGATPTVHGAVRMTEYLSGPALAGRLLVMLGRAETLPATGWKEGPVSLEVLHDVYTMLAAEPDITKRTQQVRRSGHRLSSALLTWADDVYRRESPASAASCIGRLAQTVAEEWGAAFRVWADAPGWSPYLRRIVLTGGVGIRFLVKSDSVPEKSYLDMLRKEVGPGITVERSQLSDSTERGVYLFLRQPR